MSQKQFLITRATALSILALCAVVGGARAQAVIDGILNGLEPLPARPGEEAWTFVDDQMKPLWGGGHGWSPRGVVAGEADLRRGVRVDARFPDPEGLLKTAYADLSDFLTAGKVPTNGSFTVETEKVEMPVFEAYRIEVAADRCRILAADTEGIRRGIFKVEDLMRAACGPFLTLGTMERKPFIKSRISCYFRPLNINGSPRSKDGLYYSDGYLNRMAHDGINGLWLGARFEDIVKSSVVPEFGKNRDALLVRLRKQVEHCRRYGIRIYLFSIEPDHWASNEGGHIKRHPEVASDSPEGYTKYLCPSTEAGSRFLYEALNSVFSEVPHLGGQINLTLGEGAATCLKPVSPNSDSKPTCRACAKKRNAEVMRDILAPMAKGMHDANPDAELIAWYYVPFASVIGDWFYEIPKYCNKDVTLQLNFESGVTKKVFGRGRTGSDYWLATPGPSVPFDRLARQARQAGVSMSAKIQTCNSHEVASVPFVPVPGLLYQKFKAMHELGVSHTMLCWYFGNFPGIMNKAAGELSFEPFPETEEAFLNQLAQPDWGKQADKVAQAWQRMANGYGHMPLVTEFQWWGPMHDGVVWPLLLRPQDAPLVPTWMNPAPFPPSGDRIGECLAQAYSLSEAIEECRTMSATWNWGTDTLRQLEADPGLLPQRRLDIGVAKALDIQFRSGLNILQFYDLRERMVQEKPATQIETLKEMRQIVEEELKSGGELIGLCEADSRLGFHSEANGYKYYPAKIRWRMNQLQRLLDKEFPALESEIAAGTDVFAAYSGRKPDGPSARSLFCADIGRRVSGNPANHNLPAGLDWQTCSGTNAAVPNIRWACSYDRDAFYVLIECNGANLKKAGSVTLTVEPRRLWPTLNYGMSWFRKKNDQGWYGWQRIPFVSLHADPVCPKPLRVNVRNEISGQGESSWIARKPWGSRLLINNDNPANLGWLFFDRDKSSK
ncbi:MAG: hypothetical protein PHR77_15925 [Kiritimatiellae bacterium]|nr:hypothetical protein [Kiritimatiellia bacterium]MDD5520649.1 hypothetical protein [Kiritimatiellia bacterium]